MILFGSLALLPMAKPSKPRALLQLQEMDIYFIGENLFWFALFAHSSLSSHWLEQRESKVQLERRAKEWSSSAHKKEPVRGTVERLFRMVGQKQIFRLFRLLGQSCHLTLYWYCCFVLAKLRGELTFYLLRRGEKTKGKWFTTCPWRRELQYLLPSEKSVAIWASY